MKRPRFVRHILPVIAGGSLIFAVWSIAAADRDRPLGRSGGGTAVEPLRRRHRGLGPRRAVERDRRGRDRAWRRGRRRACQGRRGCRPRGAVVRDRRAHPRRQSRAGPSARGGGRGGAGAARPASGAAARDRCASGDGCDQCGRRTRTRRKRPQPPAGIVAPGFRQPPAFGIGRRRCAPRRSGFARGAWRPPKPRGRQIDVLEAQRGEFEATLLEAKALAQRAAVDVARTVVRAPLAGRVLQLNIRTGEFAAAGGLQTPLALMGNVLPLHYQGRYRRGRCPAPDPGRQSDGAAAR